MKAASVPSEDQARQALVAGLRTRREEIEEFARAQVDQILGAKQVSDPEYTEGLRAAISVGLDFGLALIESGERRAPPTPAPLLTQARLAARNGVELAVVLRRYIAGYTLLDDFLVHEAESAGINGEPLTLVLRTQRRALNRLLAEVTKEYERETANRFASSEERLAERVQRLINGEPVDTSDIPYDFSGQHLGIVAAGPEARCGTQALARDLGCTALTIPKADGIMYAWLGSRKEGIWADLEGRLRSSWPADIPAAFGEPAAGMSGWRLTHKQARAAFAIASPDHPVRYADVALEASMSQDNLLLVSLRQLYLGPLAKRSDGEKIRQTLRAYLDANRSITGAAAAIRVDRETIRNRVSRYEALIGRSLDACMGSVRLALRLEELGYAVPPSGTPESLEVPKNRS